MDQRVPGRGQGQRPVRRPPGNGRQAVREVRGAFMLLVQLTNKMLQRKHKYQTVITVIVLGICLVF